MSTDNSQENEFDKKIKMTKPAAVFYQIYLKLRNHLFNRAIAKMAIERNFDSVWNTLVQLEVEDGKPFVTSRSKEETLLALKGTYDQNLLAEMLICRLSDAFLAYIVNLCEEIYKVKPEALASDEQISYKTILQFSSMQEVIADMIASKIDKLTHLGFHELCKFLESKFSIKVVKQEEVSEAIEIRNLIVHRNGIISPTFKRRLPNFPEQVGTKIDIDLPMYNKLSYDIRDAVNSIDNPIRIKFNLPTEAISASDIIFKS